MEDARAAGRTEPSLSKISTIFQESTLGVTKACPYHPREKSVRTELISVGSRDNDERGEAGWAGERTRLAPQVRRRAVNLVPTVSTTRIGARKCTSSRHRYRYRPSAAIKIGHGIACNREHVSRGDTFSRSAFDIQYITYMCKRPLLVQKNCESHLNPIRDRRSIDQVDKRL